MNKTLLTDEKINEISKQFIAWGKGSWGQMDYDLSPHHFAQEDIIRIYRRIAEMATQSAEYYENQI